uniref:Uncharacterized protein n=1 Tax=Strongyloides stercoralis TaxID=6248 RepID=A0AAF5CZC8_STRER
MGDIHLSMEAVVERIGGCCPTGAGSKTCKLFFGGIHLELMLVTIAKPVMIKKPEFRYYCCCFGGCYSTGAESGEWRLFCKKFEDVPILQLNLKHRSSSVMSWKLLFYRSKIRRIMKDVVKEVGGCCSTGAGSKTCKLFFERNSFRNNSNYNSETRYYCCCFGGCYSIGAESGEWKLFCKKFEDSMEAVVERIGGCCSTGAVSKTRQLFSFGRNSFSNNAKYDKLSRMWITETESEMCKLFSFGRNLFKINVSYDKESSNNAKYDKETRRGLFRINVSYDKESRYVFLFQSTALEFSHCYRCFGGCYSTGTDSEAFRLFWKKLGNALTLQLNLKHKKLFCAGMGIHLRGIRNCCSAVAGSGAWDNRFWSKQKAVVLLELDLKDGNSPGMKWRLIETVSEARRFSRNKLGAVVLQRPNLNMAVPLEHTGSCGLY